MNPNRVGTEEELVKALTFRVEQQSKRIEALKVALRKIRDYAPFAGDCKGKTIARSALRKEGE